MGDVVNLRMARKNKKRTEKADQAAENRVKFGRTKAEKQNDRREEQKKNRDLDGKKLDP